ncbi:hypothetical protein I204_02626 [Kwoniella mangroviensis CBS 8886]|nr:hypothetical protein I204_02626 [Kwoniella mangroviensis CBS 8886]
MRLATPASSGSELRSPKPVDVSQWNERTRNLTRFLSIQAHNDIWCHLSHTRQLDLPNLKILQIEADQHRPWSPGIFHKWSSEERYCPLLKALRPEIMIMRNIEQQMFEIQCRGIPSRTFLEVRTLVITSSSVDPPKLHLYQWPPPEFVKLDKVIWIVDPQAFYSGSPVYLLSSEQVSSSAASTRIGKLLLVSLLERFKDIPITIVNLGASQQRQLGSSGVSSPVGFTAEEILRNSLVQAVNNGSCNIKKEQLKKIEGLVDFITLEEFLVKEDWKDWFEKEEMTNWVAIMNMQKN